MAYYALARAGVAPAYALPSRLLVSALLLMTLLTRAVCAEGEEEEGGGGGQPLVHAALALRMAEVVPGVSPAVRLCASMLSYALASPGSSPWPPAEAPIGGSLERNCTVGGGHFCCHFCCRPLPASTRPCPRPPASFALRRHPRVCPIPREGTMQ